MFTKSQGIGRIDTSSLAKSSGLTSDSNTHSQTSPSAWAVGWNVSFRVLPSTDNSALDFLHHASQSPNSPLPALHIEDTCSSSPKKPISFSISSPYVFSLKICCSKIKNSIVPLSTKPFLPNLCKNIWKPFKVFWNTEFYRNKPES